MVHFLRIGYHSCGGCVEVAIISVLPRPSLSPSPSSPSRCQPRCYHRHRHRQHCRRRRRRRRPITVIVSSTTTGSPHINRHVRGPLSPKVNQHHHTRLAVRRCDVRSSPHRRHHRNRHSAHGSSTITTTPPAAPSPPPPPRTQKPLWRCRVKQCGQCVSSGLS